MVPTALLAVASATRDADDLRGCCVPHRFGGERGEPCAVRDPERASTAEQRAGHFHRRSRNRRRELRAATASAAREQLADVEAALLTGRSGLRQRRRARRALLLGEQLAHAREC